MEFLKSSKRRSLFSELIYIILNVALAVGVLALVLAIESPIPAFALVLLSKWRVFAVRPRYWLAHAQANLVDFIVSISMVVLLYAASDALYVQIALAVLYLGWLLFIKPRSKRIFIAIQAGAAMFLGVTAIMIVSYDWIASVVVVLMWVLGYATARHVLSSHEEVHGSFYSLVWGFVIAEIGWLAYHWTFAYALPGFGNLKLSQAALITLAMSFLAERAYSSFSKNGAVRSNDVILPALLSGSVILILIVFFNTLGTGSI